jgi:hypothetical protein
MRAIKEAEAASVFELADHTNSRTNVERETAGQLCRAGQWVDTERESKCLESRQDLENFQADVRKKKERG